jgi:nucleoside-diphosphate-sugar epimerase
MAKHPEPGLTVAVTGASGYVAARLIELLAAEDGVGRILGFDVREPLGAASSKLVFDQVDVRNPALEARLSGVDVVIHLAFVMDPLRDESEMRDVNVNGSQNVFKCAGRAGVKKLVYTSSATVYGAHPDNDVPLTEDSPLRANLDFSYPAHKLEVEYVVREFREEFPQIPVTVFRPAIVFGPHVDNAWSHLLELPVLPGVRGYRPPLQFIHEDDVSAALAFAALEELDGVFNLTPDGWMEHDEMMALLDKRRVELPEPLAFQAAERLWNVGLAEAPAGMLHYVMHPWVMSPAKLTAAGFRCRHSSYQAFIETIAGTSSRVRLGRSRMERRDLKRGAAVAAGLAGAFGVWQGVRRRWAV